MTEQTKMQNKPSSAETIWSLITEQNFRLHLVELERNTNAVPVDVQRFRQTEAVSREDHLPITVEQQLVDDVAFIAAVRQGAQSVAAVCLEYSSSSTETTFKLAAADTIDENVREMLQVVCRHMEVTHSRTGISSSSKAVFAAIIHAHQERLLGRLRSKKWTKPKYLGATHKKPLWQDFEQLLHRVQHVYPGKRKKQQRDIAERCIKSLQEVYHGFEDSQGLVTEELQVIVQQSFRFCLYNEVRHLARELNVSKPTSQISAALKTLYQVEKIGAYWRVAQNLVKTANQYAPCFASIKIQFLQPYPSTPTDIAYEPWAKTCHVHAEIQLLIHCDLHQVLEATRYKTPRVIGTSKYLCYLCHLFVLYHEGCVVSGTHGRLYDQWTIPDSPDFNTELRQRYAYILWQMDSHVQANCSKAPMWRAEPMTSRQNLLSLAPDEMCVLEHP